MPSLMWNGGFGGGSPAVVGRRASHSAAAAPMKNEPDELLPARWTLIDTLKNWDDQESWR